ncbi:MAG: hypothetical protein MUE54_01190 [Anaerolineae bacterium]|nr:hypothetical protein [Anaerolineae bacterium]
MRTTQQTPMTQQQSLINNVLWFLASLGLAFFIWISSSTTADPIIERRYTR